MKKKVYTVVVTYDIEATSPDEALKHPLANLNLPNTEIQVEVITTTYLKKGGEKKNESKRQLN